MLRAVFALTLGAFLLPLLLAVLALLIALGLLLISLILLLLALAFTALLFSHALLVALHLLLIALLLGAVTLLLALPLFTLAKLLLLLPITVDFAFAGHFPLAAIALAFDGIPVVALTVDGVSRVDRLSPVYRGAGDAAAVTSAISATVTGVISGRHRAGRGQGGQA